MQKIKKSLLFSLALLPVAIIGGIFTCLYQFDLYPTDVMEQAIAQLGSSEIIVIISTVQVCIYTLFCGFFGYLLSDKTGLKKSFCFEKKSLIRVMLITLVSGVIFSLDYWTFGNMTPQIQDATKAGMTFNGVISSVLYGGIIEEIMLRLLFMSLIAFLLWKIFFRKRAKEDIPKGIFVAANIIAALLFAAGHLPATITTFGELTPLIVFRCFLLNGGFGLIFGEVYRRYGIQYSMLSHMGLHIISKLIWIVFI